MAKIDNMMSILWILSEGKKITAKQIAEKLEINIRTVYRYIDSLSASGIPIISDSGHNGGYTLLNSFIKAPLFFNSEEQTALMHSVHLAKESGYFLSEALEKATSKLKDHSNQEKEKTIDENLTWLEIVKSNRNVSTELLLKKLRFCITNSQSVEIEYRKNHEEHPTLRILDPYGIVYWKNNWYIVAFCHKRDEIRSFRVDKIVNLIETTNTFDKPKEFSASKFLMKGLLYGSEESHIRVILEGNNSALDNLCQHWYLTNTVRDVATNRVTFLMDKEVVYKYLPNILISYGKSLKIIEPPNLKEKMIEILTDLITYHKN